MVAKSVSPDMSCWDELAAHLTQQLAQDHAVAAYDPRQPEG